MITALILLLLDASFERKTKQNRRKHREKEESSVASLTEIVTSSDLLTTFERSDLDSDQIAEMLHDRQRPSAWNATRVLRDCTRIDDPEEATQCINDVRGRRNPQEFDCSRISALKALEEHPFAIGQRKVVYRAMYRGVQVVVKKPRKNAAKSDFAVFRDEAFLHAALVARVNHVDRSLLDDRGRYLLAPEYFGVCLRAEQIMSVTRRAVPLASVALPVAARVSLAVGLLNIAMYLRQTPLGPLVHCDLHSRQLALIDDSEGGAAPAKYRPVLLDLDGLQRATVGSNVTCGAAPTHATSDLTVPCEKSCFKAWHYTTFLSTFEHESSPLEERQCNVNSGKCFGYGEAFNDWTLGALLLWELFLSRSPTVPVLLNNADDDAFRDVIRVIVAKMVQATIHQRGSITVRAIDALANFTDESLGVSLLTGYSFGRVDHNQTVVVEEVVAPNERNPEKQTMLSFAHLLSPTQLDSLMSAKDREKLIAFLAKKTERFLE